MRLLALTVALLLGISSLCPAGSYFTRPDAEIWRDFVGLLRSGPFPSERVKPYHEGLLEPMLGFLQMMQEQADWEEWAAEPNIFRVEDRIHFLMPLTFGEQTATYSFSFLTEGDEWFFQHLEAIAIRMDQLGQLPASEFPDLPEDTKAWMRAELEVSRDVWLFNTLTAEKGREAALAWFRDGAGYALAARAWVPFVDPERAFVLYLCWEQANLRGNDVALEQLKDHEAVVRLRTMYFLLYDRTAHLKQQISMEDYRRLFEFRWEDRAASAGWQIEFSYDGDECVFRLHRA